MYCGFIMYVDIIYMITITARGGISKSISLQDFYILHEVIQNYLQVDCES